MSSPTRSMAVRIAGRDVSFKPILGPAALLFHIICGRRAPILSLLLGPNSGLNPGPCRVIVASGTEGTLIPALPGFGLKAILIAGGNVKWSLAECPGLQGHASSGIKACFTLCAPGLLERCVDLVE